MADDEGWERRMYSKDLIKTHHGMFYCDSREPGRGVCVCSLQLWIISTLFSLWPTCAERRMCPRVPAPVLFSLCGCRGVEGSPYGKPDVNSKWSLSAGDNQGHKRHPRCMFPLTAQSLCRLHCSVPEQCCSAFGDRCRFKHTFHLPFVFSLWRIFLVPMEDSQQRITSFPLKSIQSLLLLLTVGYHGYRSRMVWLVHEFVYEC